MKKLLSLVTVLVLISGVVAANCINKRHAKPLHRSGVSASNTYSCTIRGDDNNSFDATRNCKNCGCSQRMHDNQ
jgi:hypothetical protein